MGRDRKEELRRQHVETVRREREVMERLAEVKAIFKKLDEGYQISKAIFSVQRYGQLKDMIKEATSEAVLNNIRHTIKCVSSVSPGSHGQAAKGSSVVGLMNKTKQLSPSQGEVPQGSQAAQAQGDKKPGKVSGFIRKVKKLTGFSDDPITEEDVMSTSELERDTGRKQRAIHHNVTLMSRALGALENLGESYEASKAHAPPMRYMELKDMIKTAVAEKF